MRPAASADELAREHQRDIQVSRLGLTPLAPTISNRCRELCRHGRTPGGWTVLWVQVRIETPRIVMIARTDRGCTSGRLLAADQRWIDGRHRANAWGVLYSAPGAVAASKSGPMFAGRVQVSRRLCRSSDYLANLLPGRSEPQQ